MNTDIYVPRSPYVLKTGQYAGKSVEILMFHNYDYLLNLLKFLKEKNAETQLAVHLAWLINQGETRKTKMLCPNCHEQPVKEFSVLGNVEYGFSIGQDFTCCEDKECRERLIDLAAFKIPQFLPFKFSVLRAFRHKSDQKQITRLFQIVFELPYPLKSLTKELAFEFFAS